MYIENSNLATKGGVYFMEHIFGRTRKILELSRKAEEIFGKAKIREALMKEKDMYDTLNHLLNEKISYITRAVNMLCLGIGDWITTLDTKGNMVEKVLYLCIYSLNGELQTERNIAGFIRFLCAQ